MNRKIANIVLGFSLVIWPSFLNAQIPATGPSVVGAQLGGLTEARGAEALWINPALLGIFDGPSKSWSLFNVQSDITLPMGAWSLKDAFTSPSVTTTFVLTPAKGAGFGDFSRSRMGTNSSLSSSLHILGLKASGFAISAQSSAYLAPNIKDRTAKILAGSTAAMREGLSATDLATDQNYSKYAAVSTAAIGLANNFGDVNKRAWGGITFKASQIHAIGIFRTQLADAQSLNLAPDGTVLTDAVLNAGDAGVVVSDLRISKATLLGADLGLTINPVGSSLFSIVASNIWQQNRVKGAREAFTHTAAAVVGRNAANELVAAGVSAEFSGQTVPAEARDDAELALSMAVFTPVVRAGGSTEFLKGRLLWGYAHPINNKPSMDREAVDRFSVGYYGAGKVSPRLSYGQKLGGQKAWSAGLATMGCGVRVGGGVDYITPTEGQARWGASFGFSVGQGACRMALR